MLTQEELDAIEAEAQCKLVIPFDELRFPGDEGWEKLQESGYRIVKMDQFHQVLSALTGRWHKETLGMLTMIKEQAAEIEKLKAEIG
jgi:hypothetical protein